MAKTVPRLTPEQIRLIVATAWDDPPPYTKTLMAHSIAQGELVQLMKREMTPVAYKLWASKAKGVKAPTKKEVWPHGK